VTASEHVQPGRTGVVRHPRPRRRTLGVIALIVIGVALAVGFLLLPGIQPPTVTCSTTDTAACTNTRNWMSDRLSRDMVFSEPLPATLLAVEVRPAPAEWKGRTGYLADAWAALLTMAGREPVLVACYYGSDDMVACDNP
jgi:hypothetical protein